MTQDSVVIDGLWKIIKAQANALNLTADLLEYFYDAVPDSAKAGAAARMDAFHKLLKSNEELIAPIRQIMESNND